MTSPMQDTARRAQMVLDELDNWDDAIVSLNLALADAAVARDGLAGAQRQMDLEEARELLGATGPNAESRKAAVLITLHERVPAYQDLLSQQRQARLRLADAERRAEVARQRCRLLREAVLTHRLALAGLGSGGDGVGGREAA